MGFSGVNITHPFKREAANQVTVLSDKAKAMHQCDGVVNTTPMGMASHPGSPVKADWLESRHWVVDIVYFPLETQLLHDAGKCGCRVLSGKGTAIYHAVQAFELFTSLKAKANRMEDCFDAMGA